ncbi:diuretic hormone class 2-like protein [Leptotrombidium deliense]|uniref:Diuretic hormone class 2-like protein n=1 Tax=Leptotrombidium deliense TaxID=299467 RepID=A0A443S582_9ACAR|nr:diuretic hormone class 2-like protein [Leptotrombidium deliense]
MTNFNNLCSLQIGRRVLVELDNPRQVIRALESLLQNIADSQTTFITKYAMFLFCDFNTVFFSNEMNSDKRGLDLGLSRGFSGRQAAKHLVGLSAAQFANGPGKKR